MSRALRLLAIAAVPLLTLGAADRTAALRNEPIQPIDPPVIDNPAKVELGKNLFFDPRLSRSGAIACASCHDLSRGGTDNLTSSIGDRWQRGPINAPTVLNARYNFVQFWDGRAKDLQQQAGGPIENPVEMASTHKLAVETIASIPQYRAEFKRVYGSDGVDIDRLTGAIAAFEETLVTPNARFDQWLKGDDRAISKQELAGYQLFKSAGCIACHTGPAVGGTMFQKMGLVAPYATRNPSIGRADVTGKAEDRHVFKVPTLRNIALTYPYFHDGGAQTLDEAVHTMGRVQLGRTFTTDEAQQIVAFLHTLTGEQPKIALPILPPSAANTPQPQPFN
ncbi:cytochrome-c peroxidase [uncultured Ralstonia sp.]|jgi:cytochrome c peroxidase|uniref:cytochrome-c peroxidase n=1 Tax=Ralstonia sp. TaxID=54061 RepID=UPI001EA99797|nr:cytochrome-c peroxidase [uncultured Ralstonia sp.]UCF25922.1 MAG: cytochrome-c peroxidase [Ralstonia sp.]